MQNRIRISTGQEILLLLPFLFVNALFLVPSAVIERAGRDAWIALIVATVAGAAISVVHTSLAVRFPRQTLIQYAGPILGPILGKIVGLMFVWFALYLGAVVLRDFGDHLVISLMPDTPQIVMHAVLMFLIAPTVGGGLEVLCRCSQIVTVIMVAATVACLGLAPTIRGFRLSNLLPIMENGVGPVAKASLIPLTFPFGEAIVFTMVIPYMNRPQEARKAHLITVVLAGFLLTMATVMILGVFDVTGAARLYAIHSLVRSMTTQLVVGRVEALFLSVWILSGPIKVAVCLYAFVLGSAQLLNLRDHRQLVMPAAVIMTALSMLVYEDIAQSIRFAAETWPVYSLPFEVGIPLVLLATSSIRRVRGRGSDDS